MLFCCFEKLFFSSNNLRWWHQLVISAVKYLSSFLLPCLHFRWQLTFFLFYIIICLRMVWTRAVKQVIIVIIRVNLTFKFNGGEKVPVWSFNVSWLHLLTFFLVPFLYLNFLKLANCFKCVDGVTKVLNDFPFISVKDGKHQVCSC